MVLPPFSFITLVSRLPLLVLALTACHLGQALHADGGMTTQELEMAERGTFSYTSLSESEMELLFEKYTVKYKRVVRHRQLH